MDQIKVGVGVIIWLDGRVLLGKRLSAHGNAFWAFPGGHVEFGELPENTAVREVFEETSLNINNLEKLHFTSDVFDNGSHYITLFFTVKDWNGMVQNTEPEKCEGWQWFYPDHLPSPLFQPVVSLLSEIALEA